jgi:hypothetical protein
MGTPAWARPSRRRHRWRRRSRWHRGRLVGDRHAASVVRRVRWYPCLQQRHRVIKAVSGRAPVPGPHRRRGLHERAARRQRHRVPYRPGQTGGRPALQPPFQLHSSKRLASHLQPLCRGCLLGQPLRHRPRARLADYRGGCHDERLALLRDRIPGHAVLLFPDIGSPIVPDRHSGGWYKHRLRPLRRCRRGQHRCLGNAGRAGARRRHQHAGLVQPAVHHRRPDARLPLRHRRLAAPERHRRRRTGGRHGDCPGHLAREPRHRR